MAAPNQPSQVFLLQFACLLPLSQISLGIVQLEMLEVLVVYYSKIHRLHNTGTQLTRNTCPKER